MNNAIAIYGVAYDLIILIDKRFALFKQLYMIGWQHTF